MNKEIEQTEIYKMFTDKDCERLKQLNWKDQLVYLKRGDTIYAIHRYWQGKTWLREQDQRFAENDWTAYFPIATKKGDTYISYEYERANPSRYYLEYQSRLKTSFPNLYWCDVGNHPYPKEIRFSPCWLHSEWNKYCHKIIMPDMDISKMVIFPSDL